MGAQFDIETGGLDSLVKRLRELEPKLHKKILRRALRKGAKPILNKARSECPVESGNLRAAIKIRSGKRRKDTVSIAVGIGAKDFVGDEFYGGFIIWGWHDPKTGELHPPNNFLARAAHDAEGAALTEATGEIRSGLRTALAGRE